MYAFFVDYDDSAGAPSFEKFARHIGVTVADVERFRSRARFEQAYRECLEIRRDYLIDRALTKRFDPSFVKFLLGEEGEAESENTESFTVKVEVCE